MNMKRQDGGFADRDDNEVPERSAAAPRRDGDSDGGSGGDASALDRPESSSSSSTEGAPPSCRSPRLARRLRGILLDDADADADLALGSGDFEVGVLRWLQALDLQVIGACRADERLKPLLKFNSSCGAAEDHLLAQLSQHFEASEVGMLIRCLCVPLVSMRVGKINKQGNMLIPTNIRGYLNLILSPSSDTRILFCSDDGCTERLAVVARNDEESEISVEEISADGSGRSFLLRLPEGNVSYFWCSEKSKEKGDELLDKMQNLFQSRPSLAQLAGISESRLESFATHMRSYLLGPACSSETTLNVSSAPTTSSTSSQSASLIVKSARSRHSSGQTGKGHPNYQGCLSPKPNVFKDSTNKSLPSMRNGTKEKLKRRVDNSNLIGTSTAGSVTASVSCENSPSCNGLDADKSVSNCLNQPSKFPGLLPCPSYAPPLVPLTFQLPFSQVAAPSSSVISPYYCWCPPCTSPVPNVWKPELPPCLGSETIPLPPLSALLSSTIPVPLQPSNQSLDCSEFPVLDFPSLFPVKSFVSLPSSQQIPTFTPFMADPIVHIPVIDICSSGPGYLVSAGPAISSAIPPLLPSLPPEPASVVEKNARETWRMLMASSSSQSLSTMLPAALTTVDESSAFSDGPKPCLLVTGSRGLYTGTQDVDAVVGGVGWLGLTPFSFDRTTFMDDSVKSHKGPKSSDSMKDVVDEQTEKPGP